MKLIGKARRSSSFTPAFLLAVSALASCAEAGVEAFRADGVPHEIHVCKPEGTGPHPIVVYQHGLIVARLGVAGAATRGYDLAGICLGLAKEGFLALAPVSPSGDLGTRERIVVASLDHARRMPDGDPTRLALAGFSQGAVLTLMTGAQTRDLRALVAMAPAGMRLPGIVERIERNGGFSGPILLLYAEQDEFVQVTREIVPRSKHTRAATRSSTGSARGGRTWSIS